MILYQNEAGKNVLGSISGNFFALYDLLYKLTFVWTSWEKGLNFILRTSSFNMHGIWEATGLSKHVVVLRGRSPLYQMQSGKWLKEIKHWNKQQKTELFVCFWEYVGWWSLSQAVLLNSAVHASLCFRNPVAWDYVWKLSLGMDITWCCCNMELVTCAE